MFRTHSGKVIDYENIDPSQIILEDIAHHLAHINRFSGALHNPISVAAHSLGVYHILRVSGADRPTLLWALLHDASEAYVNDLPSPLKRLCPEYRRIEAEIMRVIIDKFGLVYPKPAIIKEVDTEAYLAEWDYHMGCLSGDGPDIDANTLVGKPVARVFKKLVEATLSGVDFVTEETNVH